MQGRATLLSQQAICNCAPSRQPALVNCITQLASLLENLDQGGPGALGDAAGRYDDPMA